MGWPVRVAVILLVLAMAAATIAWVVLDAGRGDLPSQGASQDRAAPAQPDRGRPQPVSPTASTTAAPTTTSTPPGSAPGQPANPATTTTGPSRQVTFPVPGPPVSTAPLPGIPTGPTTITVTETPAAPVPATKETIRLPDDRTIQCPMPYLGTNFGPLAVCTHQSGDQASIGFYSPFTQNFNPSIEGLRVLEPTWYDTEILGTDGISAKARGYATVETMYGPAIWATQYQQGRARWGIVNLITNRFQPDGQGWLSAG